MRGMKVNSARGEEVACFAFEVMGNRCRSFFSIVR